MKRMRLSSRRDRMDLIVADKILADESHVALLKFGQVSEIDRHSPSKATS